MFVINDWLRNILTCFQVWHCTFLVNSSVFSLRFLHFTSDLSSRMAHWDGLQPYSDEDTSRGNLVSPRHTHFDRPLILLQLLALLTSGEGSHNFVRRACFYTCASLLKLSGSMYARRSRNKLLTDPRMISTPFRMTSVPVQPSQIGILRNGSSSRCEHLDVQQGFEEHA